MKLPNVTGHTRIRQRTLTTTTTNGCAQGSMQHAGSSHVISMQLTMEQHGLRVLLGQGQALKCCQRNSMVA